MDGWRMDGIIGLGTYIVEFSILLLNIIKRKKSHVGKNKSISIGFKIWTSWKVALLIFNVMLVGRHFLISEYQLLEKIPQLGV